MRFPFIKLSVLFLTLTVSLFSQAITDDISIKFGGYINWTANYDTRQTVNFREGYFMLYPAEEKPDNLGRDINAKSSFNFLAIQTRLNSKVEGPQALGAKTVGFIEAEFFGTSDGDMNGMRLRHAYVSLKWDKTTLLIGQTWHPMFVAEAFPGVVSFNTGVPFQPFSRNPQIKVTHSFDGLTVIAALLSQRDFTSGGPNGFSSVYLRNSGVPAAHLQLQYKTPDFLFGAGGDVKVLSPRIETAKKISTDETLESYAGIAYAKYSKNNFSVTVEGVYGQNMADYLMLGGYSACSYDTSNGAECYTNLKAYSLWGDISYGSDLQVGLFAGYTKNLGSDRKTYGPSYARVSNIDDMMRVSPRIQYTSGKIKFAGEVEITRAAYGKPDEYGKVLSAKNITNTRFVVGTFYFF